MTKPEGIDPKQLAAYQSLALIGQLPVACWFKDISLRYQWHNGLWSEYLNVHEKLENTSDTEILPHWLAEQMLSADLLVLAQNCRQEQSLSIDLGAAQNRFLLCIRQPVYDENQQLMGILGFALDDTERELSRRRLHQQSTSQANWLHALKNHTLISTMNRRGQFTYISDQFAKLIGLPASDLIGQSRRNFPLLPETSSLRYYLTMAEQGQAISFEFSGQTPTGEQYWIRSLLIALNSPSDTEQVFLELATDLTNEKDAQAKLEEVNSNLVRVINENTELIARLEVTARTDSLTGLANRRALFERAEQEISRCARNCQALSLVMLDIDHFKEINDNHGHEIGDQALIQLGQWVCELLRTHDLFARTGGEEFVLLLPETNLAQAKEVAERVRDSVYRQNIALPGGGSIHFTTSLGLTEIKPSESLETALSRADKALYQAKASGRNCVYSN